MAGASTTPTSTINTFFFHYKEITGAKPVAADFAKAEKVVDIKSYGDLGGEPNTIESTTLSDKYQRTVNGVQKLDAIKITSNYIKGDSAKLKTLADKGEGEWWAIVMGADASGVPDGHDGIYAWQGGLSFYEAGGEVDKVRETNIVVNCNTAPELVE